MRLYTAASCFSTYLLPHILFVPDFEERRRVVQACCLAWNISLFPDAAERERQLDMVWKLVGADNREPPPPGFEQGFKQDLRTLIAEKRDLFPWLTANIPMADLVQKNARDVLRAEAGGKVEETQLVTCPEVLLLPTVIDVLRDAHRDTLE